MKKIITSSSVNRYENDWVRIYCQADLNKCVSNLIQLKSWLKYDYEGGKIPAYIYDEYFVVIDNTTRSLQMVIKDEGQCDTTKYKVKKLEYTTKK